MYCYTKLATVWEYQNKLADTPNFQRKVERRAQIFVARSRYCEVLSFGHITLMPVQMRLLYCESIEMNFDRAKCFQLRTEITNARFWAVQYEPEGRGFDF
jgi:hypothetical protein